MSEGQILLLGAIAGFTIFLGLPVGRVRNLSMPMRAFLNAGAAGILVFLLIEVFNHGFEPVEHAVEDGEWATLVGKGALFAGLFALGLVGLVYYDRRLSSRPPERPIGPGAATAESIRLSSARSSPVGAEAPRATDRGRHRPAQLLRGARNRAVGCERRDQARAAARHRLRAAQLDRGLRHRRDRCAPKPTARAGVSSAQWD